MRVRRDQVILGARTPRAVLVTFQCLTRNQVTPRTLWVPKAVMDTRPGPYIGICDKFAKERGLSNVL